MLKKEKLTVVLDPDAMLRLDATAERYGMTKNTLISAAALELSRVPAEQLFHRLARLNAEENDAASKRIAAAKELPEHAAA